MTDHVELGGEEVSVFSSDVYLELANRGGEVITLRRTAKGERAPELITVWRGPALTSESGEWPAEDFFVRLGGAATSPSGFHHFLASFLGWDLPSVLRFNGDEGPLYLECIFPLLYIEQMRGWTDIGGRFPTHYRIREPGPRAVEFLLALDVRDVAERKAAIRARMENVRARWARVIAQADATVARTGGRLQNVPREPVSEWPQADSPHVLISQGDEWIPVREHIAELESRKQSIGEKGPQRVAEAAPDIEAALAETEERLRSMDLRSRSIAGKLQAAIDDIGRTQRRLRSIEEDLVRNKDALRLQKLGSSQQFATEGGNCPTCKQALGVALLPEIEAAAVSPMSLEDNIQFLEEHRKVFLLMERQAKEQVDAYERQLAAARDEANAQRARIRTLKTVLTSDSRQASSAEIAESVRLEDRIEALFRAEAAALDHTNALTELASEWENLRSALKALPKDRLSAEDMEKLDLFQERFTDQVIEYGLGSLLNPAELYIERDSYQPVYQGFDLMFDLAGSDTTRAAWAYRVSLLEVARELPTNHPGILIVDEPQQQNPARESFAAFLQRLARAGEFDQQVVVATSEASAALEEMLSGQSYQLLELPNKLIQPDRA